MDVLHPPHRRVRRHVVIPGLVALLLVALALGMRALPQAAPSVERAMLWMDEVRRGPLVRQVLGPGTLVPERVRWLTAPSNARVESVVEKPGASVESDSVVARLSSSQLELAALEAEREVSRARAELAQLQASGSAEHLAQRSVIATLTSELADAERRARADEELGQRGFLSALEREQTLGRESELRGRLDFERQRLQQLGRGLAARVKAHESEIARLQAIAEFRREEVDALVLRAGVDGVLSELSLEPGQAVTAGALLGKVVQPDRLKAVLRVPETQTQDLRLGQATSIDTHAGVIPGHVVRIDPAAQEGNVRVDVALQGPLPAGARPDLNVQGTIELERLESVLLMGRPAVGQPGTRVSLFRLNADASAAERTDVQLGRSSVEHVEVLSGLREGDRVILSELSEWDEVERIRLR